MVSDSTPMYAELTESDNGEQRFSIFGTTRLRQASPRQKDLTQRRKDAKTDLKHKLAKVTKTVKNECA